MRLSKKGRQRLGYGTVSRRVVLSTLAGAAVAGLAAGAVAQNQVSFGLTPVMLESDHKLLAALEAYLSRQLRQPVALVKRRTYQEITALLLSGQLSAAWICGFPYVQHRDRLGLLAVPLYRNQPLYQSYIIVDETSRAASLEDLRGRVHAFSDPDSNSGFLVTRHLLAVRETTPTEFFRSFFFTDGHRNVIRAVAAGLAESGSVDGYVWDVMAEREPDLVKPTKVIRRSELLGFPPVATLGTNLNSPLTTAIAAALLRMHEDELGREVLRTLHLDGFTAGRPELFDAIADKWRVVREQA